MEDQVGKLIEKAGKADAPLAALQFTQAALNAANAIAVLDNIKKAVDKPMKAD
jgi:uncharacterized protein (UPF0147 family)